MKKEACTKLYKFNYYIKDYEDYGKGAITEQVFTCEEKPKAYQLLNKPLWLPPSIKKSDIGVVKKRSHNYIVYLTEDDCNKALHLIYREALDEREQTKEKLQALDELCNELCSKLEQFF